MVGDEVVAPVDDRLNPRQRGCRLPLQWCALCELDDGVDGLASSYYPEHSGCAVRSLYLASASQVRLGRAAFFGSVTTPNSGGDKPADATVVPDTGGAEALRMLTRVRMECNSPTCNHSRRISPAECRTETNPQLNVALLNLRLNMVSFSSSKGQRIIVIGNRLRRCAIT